VLCSNVLDTADFRALMREQRAAMVFAGPPDNMPTDGHATGLGSIRDRSFAIAAGKLSHPGTCTR
jgi:hypothetical protein